MSNPFFGSFGPVAMLGGVISPPSIIGSTTTDTLGNITTKSVSHTVAAGTNKLVVLIGWGRNSTPSVSSIAWNTSESLTERLDIIGNNGGSERAGAAFYYLDNPTAGTHNIDITFSAPIDDGGMAAVNLSGALSGNEHDNDSSTSASAVTTLGPVTSTPLVPCLVFWLAAAARVATNGITLTGPTNLFTNTGNTNAIWSLKYEASEIAVARSITFDDTAGCVLAAVAIAGM